MLRGGWGAWEIASRFSAINLNDAEALNPTRGGKEHNLTVGVNWYLNPNTRVTWNYVYGKVDRLVSVTGNAGNTSFIDLGHDRFGIFMMRFQVDF